MNMRSLTEFQSAYSNFFNFWSKLFGFKKCKNTDSYIEKIISEITALQYAKMFFKNIKWGILPIFFPSKYDTHINPDIDENGVVIPHKYILARRKFLQDRGYEVIGFTLMCFEWTFIFKTNEQRDLAIFNFPADFNDFWFASLEDLDKFNAHKESIYWFKD